MLFRSASSRSPGHTSSIDLPVPQPLSHDNEYLNTADFNVEDFLQSRLYTSLPDLRTELREYLAKLKEELVRLINDDYEAFISLSTDLQGEGERLERIKWPLGDIRSRVQVGITVREFINRIHLSRIPKRTCKVCKTA